MKQLVVSGSFPYTTHTFVTREVGSTHKANHDVHVLAPTTGDAAGEEFCARVGFPKTRVIYRNYLRCPMFSADLHRFTPRVTEAAMREIYGYVLGERRKSYFCELIKDPRIRDADLIHAHFVGWGYMVAIPLARILGIPVTVIAHEVELPDIKPETLRFVQRHADSIIVVSSEYKRHWVNLTGSEEKLHVVHNGVDLSEFELRATPPRTPPGRIRLVSVARLIPHKRIADGIQAVRRLVDRGIDAEYHIVGDGPERPALEALCGELHVEERVRLLGFSPTRSALIAELLAADVLIHPSEAEAFGVSPIEGMAAGLPGVVARSGGIKDIVDMHGCFGYLYEPGDVDTLVDYVAQLANDPAKRELFGKAARTAAETRFSWENRMSELFRVWDQVRATHRREKV
jgi:glycosyltransferase involved in cell wall biosynthesis